MILLRDLIRELDAAFPLRRAENWDKVGLQIGDENAPVARAVVAHEATDATLDDAQNLRADALVVYHPLLFRPLDSLNFRDHTARLAARCITQNLNLVAMHTALDNAPPLSVKAPGALGDALAHQLGLQNVQVLAPSGRESLCKIVVFVPPQALDAVQSAMWQAGAGQIGLYDEASFRTPGRGTFRPLAGANPHVGALGQREDVDEWRLEIIVPEAQSEEVIAVMKSAHPYEEVAYDVIPLRNATNAYGSARVGELETGLPFDAFAAQVQANLSAPNLRLVRAGKNEIRRVACVPGSGASYIEAAARGACDCLVTGDIKHHDALKAQALGLALIDATHTATERAAVPMLRDVLQIIPGLTVEVCGLDTNPFSSFEL